MNQNDYYNVSRILEEMEIELYKNYKKAMMRDIDKPAKQWRELQILNLQHYKKQNKKIIEYYNKLLRKEVDKSLKEAYKDGIIEMLKIEERTEQYFLDKIDYSRMNKLLDSVHHDYDKAIYSSQRLVDDIYRQNVFKSEVYFNSGTLTLKQSVDLASRDFIDMGIKSITYSDGKKIDICSYSDMVMRTNGHRVKLQGESNQAAEFDIVTAFVSSHGSTCEKCAPFEGLMILDDVNNDLTKEQEEMYSDLIRLSYMYDYGWGHPNCRHSLIYTEPDSDSRFSENDMNSEMVQKKIDRYNREQEQRRLEREIRKAKRKAVTTLDPEAQKKAQAQVREEQKNMRQFLSENPDLVRRYERENTELTRRR